MSSRPFASCHELRSCEMRSIGGSVRREVVVSPHRRLAGLAVALSMLVLRLRAPRRRSHDPVHMHLTAGPAGITGVSRRGYGRITARPVATPGGTNDMRAQCPARVLTLWRIPASV